MNTWKILADIVMYLHVILPLLFIGILISYIFRTPGRRWQIVFYVLLGGWIILEIAPSLHWTQHCPLTDLEYFFRHHYDPTGSYIRVKSLTATVVYNLTGASLPEWVFTGIFGVIMAGAAGALITKWVRRRKLSRR